jgi:hypothetical protein
MMRKQMMAQIRVFGNLIFLVLFSTFVYASEPIIWETNSRTELMKGESRGVSVTDSGALILAPQFTQIFNTEQSYIWSSVADSVGNVYLGTGHDGRIFRVTPDGKGGLFTDTNELDVTALAVGPDKSLYAGTSPDGKVYRIGSNGRADVYFDPPDKYIWSIVIMADGSLVVGTGDNGRIYRVRSPGANADSSILIDVDETHIISLAIDSKGNLIAGTDPSGFVLRISNDGKAFALFDSPLREIHDLATAPDGSIFALALSDTAATQRASSGSGGPSSGQSGQSSNPMSGSMSMIEDASGSSANVGGQSSSRSRNDISNARSAVFRILPDGGTDVLWSSTSVTAFAIAAQTLEGQSASRVLIGTSDKGRIISVTNDGRDTLLIQSTEGQISSFIVSGRDIYAASSNQGKLFRLGNQQTDQGTFESTVRDTKLVASWGRIWWRGTGDVELQTRSGNTERPDTTWSDWSPPYRDSSGSVSSPRARFIQWRAVLKRSVRGETRVEDVSLAYLPRNVAPEIISITTLPVGVGLQPAIQMQTDPNIEASGLDPSLFGAVASVPPRRIYQQGAVSLQWQAEDRNDDVLEYAVYYRALNESNFHPLKDKLKDTFYTVDGATLADGRYLFKVVASDAPKNPVGQALTGERISEPVDVDNSPPMIKALGDPQISGNRVRVSFMVEDATGMIKRAEVSIDGANWVGIFPEDGIADSSRESYVVDQTITGTGEHTISLRGFDASGNVGSMRMTVRK